MLGTLNGALEVRGIRLDPEDISAEAEGVTRLRDRMPLLEEIIVHYRLRVPAEARETVDRALASHGAKCPTFRVEGEFAPVSWGPTAAAKVLRVPASRHDEALRALRDALRSGG